MAGSGGGMVGLRIDEVPYKRMKQTRKNSLVESIVNVGIGYTVAVLSQAVVFPLFNIHITFTDNLLIGLWFTVISIARSYLVRRWFIWKTE